MLCQELLVRRVYRSKVEADLKCMEEIPARRLRPPCLGLDSQAYDQPYA